MPSRDYETVLKVIRMRIQAYNEILNKTLDENVGKSGCMSLTNGFMKLVRRENNLNKKASSIYLMSHGAIDRAYTTLVTPDLPIIKHIQTLKSYLKLLFLGE